MSELDLAGCTRAVATLTSGVATLASGSPKDYGTEWPKGCFKRSDKDTYFYNTGGTTATSPSGGLRICATMAGVCPLKFARVPPPESWSPSCGSSNARMII